MTRGNVRGAWEIAARMCAVAALATGVAAGLLPCASAWAAEDVVADEALAEGGAADDSGASEGSGDTADDSGASEGSEPSGSPASDNSSPSPTGWTCIDDTWYYVTEDGELAGGWLYSAGAWYWLDPDSGAMATGWQTIDGITYRFSKRGGLCSGWQFIDGTWYYLNPSHDGSFGALRCGWTWVDGHWYLLDRETGAMRTGWVLDDGAWYYLHDTGEMACRNTVVDGQWQAFARDGRWRDALAICDQVQAASGAREVVTFGGWTAPAEAIERVEQAIAGVRTWGYDIGFVMLDLATGKGASYNADRTFYAASSIKAHYIAAVAEAHPEVLSEQRTPIEEVLFRSSDVWYKYLRGIYGNAPIEQWCATSGSRMALSQTTWVFHTPREFARLWLRDWLFFDGSDTGAELAGWYTTPSWSAMAMRADGVRVASKAGYVANGVGSPYNASCDGGIVYAANGSYVLAVMSNIPAYLPMLEDTVRAIDALHAEV